MAKFKIGDKVRLKSDIVLTIYNGISLTSYIKDQINLTDFVIVSNIEGDRVKINRFWVGEDALELYPSQFHIYSIGDKVKIKKREEGRVTTDYPFGFNTTMSRLAGTICVITEIIPNRVKDEERMCKYFNGDCSRYKLESIDSECDVNWCWHSSMFEPVLENSEQKVQTLVSLHKGDLVEICGMTGSIHGLWDDSAYYLDFTNIRDEQDHFACCKKLRELVPNFDKIADEFDPIQHESGYFPEFSTINDLVKFVQAINNAYNSKKLITSKTLNENEIKFQKPKASYVRGSVPKGNPICGRKHKTAIVVGCLSNQEISC